MLSCPEAPEGLLPPLGEPTLAAFCEVATARARRVEPLFDELTEAGLEVTSRWYAGWIRSFDARRAGRGWVLEVEERDVGPAETIQQHEWIATAHGEGWTLRITRFDDIGHRVRLWETLSRTPADAGS